MSIGGLQIAWAVELSNGSPYLLSLGISKSLMALVWIAGPLSGVLVQPYVGIRSDRCRVTWGKRRPFMIGGALATIVSLLMLAWTREIVEGVYSWFDTDLKSQLVKVSIIVVAILFIYVLDFAINVVQAAIRAFIVDCAPPHQQESANAWAGRMSGIGNVLGYLSGYVSLPKLFPFLGNTQFKVLCAIACIALGTTVAISSLYIKERDPNMDGPVGKGDDGILTFFRGIYRSIRKLPTQIYRVCDTQFFAWIGWFPFLFYITTYIGEIYVRPYYDANPNMSKDEEDALWEQATRQGTLALFVYAIAAFTSNMLLPFIVAPSMSNSRVLPRNGTIAWMLELLVIPWLTLRRTWILSHILFALCMFSTFFIESITAATIMTALCGIAWAVTIWAPFAIISAEVSKRDSARRHILASAPEDGDLPPQHDQAGVILGIHNVAIAAPQMIATLGSSLIFRLLQKQRGAEGDNSLAWVLRIGGVAALIAATRAKKLFEEGKDDGDEGEAFLPSDNV